MPEENFGTVFRAPVLRKLTKELDVQIGRFTQFPLIRYEGIHCAYCEGGTLTQEAKLDLFKRIFATKNIAELSEVVSENARFIKEKNSYIVEMLATAAQKDPNYDCNELLKEMKKFVLTRIKDTMTSNYREISLLMGNKISEKSSSFSVDHLDSKGKYKDTPQLY